MADKNSYYYIPPNFAEDGTLFAGRIKTRNAVETALLVFLFIQPLLHLDLSMKSRIYIGIIFILPLAIFGIVGIQGLSLTGFVSSFFIYLKNRRVMAPPDDKEIMLRNRKNLKKQERQERQNQKAARSLRRREVRDERRKRAKEAAASGKKGKKGGKEKSKPEYPGES